MRVTLLLSVCTILLALPARAPAQTATGQITGAVKDTSGALMARVKIVVTNQQTGLTRETTTNENGDYVVPLLPVGTYVVTAEQSGFKLAVRSDVGLNVDQVQRIDMQLDAGNVSETVEVRSTAVALDTASASIGHNITARQVTELPLNGRNFLQLLFLGAGAVETTGEQGGMRQGAGNAISIMGARPTSNNYMLDGTSNTDTALGTPAAILSVDAIQEFKEQTTTYSAEYRLQRQPDQHRHQDRDQCAARHRLRVPPERRVGRSELLRQPQQSSARAGSEAVRVRRRRPGTAAVLRRPQPELLPGQLRGDAHRARVQLLLQRADARPAGRTLHPDHHGSDDGAAVSEQHDSRVPLLAAGAARAAQQLVARAEHDRAAGQLSAGPDASAGVQISSPSAAIRISAKLGRVFVRVTKSMYENRTNSNFLEIGDRVFEQETMNWQVSHTLPLRSNFVNQFRVGRADARADQAGIGCPQGDVDFLQSTGTFTGLPDVQRECPSIGIQGLSGTGGAVNAYSASNQPMWDISNTTTWIKGDHALNFGFNYRRWWLQRDLATGFLGNYNFNVGFTGHPVADMLLGYYSGVGIFQPASFSVPGQPGNPREFNFLYFAPYFQDDWKVSSTLTLNLGLRWDYRNVPYETRNRMAWRNLDYGPGGLLVADASLADGGIVDGAYYQEAGRRSPENPDRFKVFAPRLGFAWRPFGEKTVVRGGYGVFFDSAEGREIDGAADVYPYVSRGNYIQSIGQPTPLRTSDSLFPSFAAPGVATPAANTFLAVNQSPEPRNPKVEQWSFGMQRELFASTTLELNYIGTQGSNLLMRRNIAQALPYDPANPSPVAARKPFPNFVVYIDSDWGGRSNYNAFNAKVEHRTRARS